MYKGVNSLYLYIVAIDEDTTLAERKEFASVAQLYTPELSSLGIRDRRQDRTPWKVPSLSTAYITC